MHAVQAIFSSTMPRTTNADAKVRQPVMTSLKMTIAISDPNRTLVSRSAATSAMGAWVIAQITMKYAHMDIAPPPAMTGQCARKPS